MCYQENSVIYITLGGFKWYNHSTSLEKNVYSLNVQQEETSYINYGKSIRCRIYVVIKVCFCSVLITLESSDDMKLNEKSHAPILY